MLKKSMVSLLFVVFLIVGPACGQERPEKPKNVILLIADGTGPATFTLARDYVRWKEGRAALALDAHLTGSVRTHATDSRVTDSAASATAYSAGVKTYNGAIAVDTLRRPVATLLEAAEQRGLATGLVATSTITHATPAAFAAHVPSRAAEAEIASQEMAQGIEVLFGGGRVYFLPDSLEGRRTDGRNLLDEARAQGYQVALSRADFDGSLRTPVLGLFSNYHLDYEIDRNPQTQPSLAEMTRKAIDLLGDDPDGFFLMVEGSRIDHAGHGNDAAGHLHDLLAFEEAMAAALAFAEENGETLVVSTSDHETGGLSLGRNIDERAVYAWRPEVLDRVRSSHGPMIDAIMEEMRPAADVLREFAAIDDLSEAELVRLDETKGDGTRLNYTLAEIIGRRTVLGWTTGGHTAVDVPLFAFGPGQERFEGNLDNSEIGKRLAALLGFDLPALTERLRAHEAGSE